MTKRIIPLDDFISASEAARILSEKLGRRIRPDYIHQLKGVRSVKKNDRCKLYHKEDIEAVTIRKRERRK
jgi:hypothetical protein